MNYSIEEIIAFIEGKFPAEKTEEFKKALEFDDELREIYEDFKSREETIKLIDNYKIKPEFSRKLFATAQKILEKTKPSVGEVWKIKGYDLRALVIDVNKYDARVLLVSNYVPFALPHDLIINDINFSQRPSVIHTHLSANVLLEHFETYVSEVNKDILSAAKRLELGKRVSPTESYRLGNKIDEAIEEDYEIWAEYMREVLYAFHSETLNFLEGASRAEKENSQVIFPLPKSDEKIPDVISQYYYSHAASSADVTEVNYSFWEKIESSKSITLFELPALIVELTSVGGLLLLVIYTDEDIEIDNIAIMQRGKIIEAEPKTGKLRKETRAAFRFNFSEQLLPGEAELIFKYNEQVLRKKIIFE